MKGELYINGEWVQGRGGKFVSTNPVSDESLGEFCVANADDVNDAVASAKCAFKSWSSLILNERKAYLYAFQDILNKEKESLAQMISQETGKPLWESLTEINAMINKIPITIKAFEDRCLNLPMNLDDKPSHTYFKPHGVVGIFGPFNLPGHLPNGHIIPALLIGNTCLFKPSDLTPLVGEHYISLWHQVGLPKGVINLVQGDAQTGKAICQHDDVKGIFFTGSSQTGKAIHQSFAGQPKKILALEMGGNNPLIVSDIQDIKAVAYMIIQSAFITSGQRCTCARRLIVVANEHTDSLLKHLVEMSQTIKVGAYDDSPQPFIGPVISKESARHILEWQERLVQQGGNILLEMKRLGSEAMLSPGIIDVTRIEKKEDVEIFGPLLQVIKVQTMDEAIKEANSTQFGLSAGIISSNKDDYQQLLNSSFAGIINWNKPTTGASSSAPFGGVGESGNHRPSAYFAVDYCSYPVATMHSETIELPETTLPGIDTDIV